MTVIQQQLGIAPLTFTAWYDGGDGEILPGYSVCYELAAADGTVWDDQKLWTTVVKPATANLQFYAGVVTAVLQGGQGSSNQAYVSCALPTRGSVVQARVSDAGTLTIGEPMSATDGQWHLIVDATVGTLVTGGGDAYSWDTVALAGETYISSGTAANKRVFGLL